MITQDRLAPPTFQSSSVVIDWSKDKMPAFSQSSSTSNELLGWVKSFPTPEQVHVYLGNVAFTGQRTLMRQLQAMGCRVTCRQYQ